MNKWINNWNADVRNYGDCRWLWVWASVSSQMWFQTQILCPAEFSYIDSICVCELDLLLFLYCGNENICLLIDNNYISFFMLGLFRLGVTWYGYDWATSQNSKWQCLHINNYRLLLKWIEAFPLKVKSAKEVARNFCYLQTKLPNEFWLIKAESLIWWIIGISFPSARRMARRKCFYELSSENLILAWINHNCSQYKVSSA